VGVYVYLNSPQFNERLRAFVVQKAAEHTGARVTLGSFQWSVRSQQLVLKDITFRGTEPESEPPLGHIESISAGIKLRSLLQRRIDLFDLQIVGPEIHLRVDADGRTNLPGPVPQMEQTPESRLTVSIDRLKVINGRAYINDRQTKIDFDIKDLSSDLLYRADTQTLTANVSYSGKLDNPGSFSIPYSLSSEFDLTRGTILARQVEVTSGKSSSKLQGRIDKVFTPEIAGKLAYTGRFEGSFLKHFLPRENFGGVASAQGTLEFSPGQFSTSGDLTSQRVEFEGWTAEDVRAGYRYRYPQKQLDLTKVSAAALGGNAKGKVTLTPLPGKPRFEVDLDYSDINAAQFANLYPWDQKYIVYSSAQGHVKGWFEGKLERYEFEGNSVLSSYSSQADSGMVALPLQGTVLFDLKPGEANIRNADLRLFEATIRSQGRVAGTYGDLTVDFDSPNLTAFNFLHPDLNGKGSFKGTLKGSLQKPVLDGNIVADGYKYREWTIRHAEGSASLDTQSQVADLRDIKVEIGESRATVKGTAKLDGSSVNLRIQSDHVRAEDFASVVKEKISGILSGTATVTSLNPLRVTGHVNATRLTARGHTLETFTGNVTYNDPVIEITNATASELGTDVKLETLKYDSTTGALNVTADVSSLGFNRLREVGVPETIGGNIQKAHITVTGTQSQPRIDGKATIENLSFRNEVFPLVEMTLETNRQQRLIVKLSGLQNLALAAEIDLTSPGYRFTAEAGFTDYSVERLANFSKGTLIASGSATFEGELKGQKPLSGKGTIRSIQASILEYGFKGAKPFPFEFDANRLTLTEGASFNGAYSTLITLKGSIGLTNSPPLDLEVTGNLDLSEVTAAYEGWSVTGRVNVDGKIGGTTVHPTITGNANITNGSLGRENVNMSLSGFGGNVFFNENRVTFNNLEGRVGLGTVRLRGNAMLQNSRVEGLNVRIDADQIRLRYPEGLRSSLTGSLLLRGTSVEPSLEGNLRLDSLAYRSEFESFLSVFRPGGLNSGGTPLDHLRLSVHVAGNRNIVVQNELTDITGGRIDLDIKGTLGSPTLTGHVEATEGSVIVNSKRYEVTRGNIDFVDPFRIEPVVDIQAEADVREYRVILIITGKGDNIVVDMRSDPPLPRLEIISLIAGGKTRDELGRIEEESGRAGRSTVPTSEELFQGGAVTILTDLLRSRVGNRFGLMGLDFIRVDLPIESTNSNPSLRVTLSQQVSKDLSVTYSQDLSTSQQRLILVEYFLNKNLSIVASREEANEISALGLDVKLRKRF
jgi:autotransporter translocation and assembly factor TamB